MRRVSLAVIMLAILVFPGCLFARYVPVPDRHPVYKLPERSKIAKVSAQELEPVSTETKMKIVKTVTELKGEAAQLRVMLESYNEYAERKNAQYDERFKKEKIPKWQFWRR